MPAPSPASCPLDYRAGGRAIEAPGLQRAVPPTASAMTRKETISVVNALSDALAVLLRASLADKAAIYGELGLRLVCQPGRWIAVAAR